MATGTAAGAPTPPAPEPVATIDIYPPGADQPRFGPLRHLLAPGWRSIVVSAGLVLAVAVALLAALPRPDSAEVRVVDPSHAIAQAASQPGFPVYLPMPLPAGWYPNSARFDHAKTGPHLHIGYLTPDHAYAGLEESSGTNRTLFVTNMAAGAVFQEAVLIDGQLWVHVASDRKKQDSLVWYGPQTTVIVTGTTTVQNLTAFAASLHVRR
jgi:hypothetical protein